MKKIFLTILAGLATLSACFSVACSDVFVPNDDDFVGLYDNVKSEEVTFTYTKPNMMYDFEEVASLHHNLYYNNIVAEVSLNTDKKYVTCGNASMKIVAHGRADKGYWSTLEFMFDSKFSDFRKIKAINIDILYEHPDGSNVEYSIGGTSSNPNNRFETTNKVYAKSGEWFNFVIQPNERMDNCQLGGTWNHSDEDGPGLYMPQDLLKSMNRLYFSFKPFKQGQKPVTVYFDNIYVEYFE